jgi:putative transposase
MKLSKPHGSFNSPLTPHPPTASRGRQSPDFHTETAWHVPKHARNSVTRHINVFVHRRHYPGTNVHGSPVSPTSGAEKGTQLIVCCDGLCYRFEMPRRPRICPAGMCFHVLNRAVARLTLFEKQEDYEAFERVLEEAIVRERLPIFSYIVMPNHWHFVVRPKTDGQLSAFFRWLTHTHTMRWHAHYHTEGTGHLYQGRFKTFPIQSDDHLLTVLRYVEQNALRGKLCERAEDWQYGSLWRHVNGDANATDILAKWPIERPRQWKAIVNRLQKKSEVGAIRHSVKKGTPYGSDRFISQSVARLELQHTLRSRGRPRKHN